MERIYIHYYFRLPAGAPKDFKLVLDSRNLELIPEINDHYPQWARLEYHQCPNCQLTGLEFCPLMANVSSIVGKFDDLASYDEVELEVHTPERCISQHTAAQRGISSLLGLVMATSPCPHTLFLRPMARFHLPLATEEETIYRAVSTYLMAQYFLGTQNQPHEHSLRGLNEIYSNLHTINVAIAERLREASRTDSSVNALIMLDLYTKAMPYVIDESLEELRYLFEPYLDSSSAT